MNYNLGIENTELNEWIDKEHRAHLRKEFIKYLKNQLKHTNHRKQNMIINRLIEYGEDRYSIANSNYKRNTESIIRYIMPNQYNRLNTNRKQYVYNLTSSFAKYYEERF